MVATAVTAYVANSLISGALENRMETQIEHVSDLVSRGGFALNRPILERLKQVLGADVVTYRADGTVLASTLPAEPRGLLGIVEAPEMADRLFRGGERVVVRAITHHGQPWLVAWRPLEAPERAVVAFAMPTADIAAAKRAIAWRISLIASVMVLWVAVVSQLVARSITLPVHRLVGVTRRLAAGETTERADVGSRDEIGALARAFDDMAERLRQSRARLVRSEKLAAAGQLAAGVAHDIRNPLSAIKMQAQMLRTRLVPGEANQALLQAILGEIDRVERVVQGLLDVASPAELRLEPGDVNAVVADALALTEAQLRHQKIAVERKLAPGLPAVRFDGDRLRQAVLNVIVNAGEAMPTGGMLVATTRVAAGAGVEIEIADDGEGLAPQARAHLFEPFFTTKKQGVGLGLVNTRSIVERHGGTIALVPGEVRGTRAIITLPAATTGG